MSFTRFHDDPCRITKQNQQSTDPGRWILDVPGNGDKPCFMMDPQIIPQKWGGNLWSNCIDVQSSLLGIDRKLSRSCPGVYEDSLQKIKAYPMSYPKCYDLTTEQSRVTNPAWMYKDLEQPNWDYLPNDPQSHVTMPFANNVSSRILEKDHFQRQFDCIPQKGFPLPVTNRTSHIV